MEQEFKNEVIDTFSLPRYEDVQLTKLHISYRKVIIINLLLFFLLLAAGCGAAIFFIKEVRSYYLVFILSYIIIVVLTLFLSNLGFKNRGFAFRAHDVIYRSGVIAINTTIIPYNRIQHAALHEGFISSKLGLATIEIFTAGGLSSDIKIPGIEKEHAENIRQLLVAKILNQADDE